MTVCYSPAPCMLHDCVGWGEQVQAKRADENLADWIVHITTDADRQGSDAFVQAYARCAVSCCSPCFVRPALKAAAYMLAAEPNHHVVSAGRP